VIAAIIALAVVVVVLAGVVGALVGSQGRERRDWAAERRQLVDRAIAHHTGEVIALDRAQLRPKRDVEPRVPVEGLN
jgi:type II secretory pathway pseudopilin PulG